jgi:hypothetical protein
MPPTEFILTSARPHSRQDARFTGPAIEFIEISICDFARNLTHTVPSSAKVFGHPIHIAIAGPPKTNKRLPKNVNANFINPSLPSCKKVLIGGVKDFRVAIKLNLLTQLTYTGQ